MVADPTRTRRGRPGPRLAFLVMAALGVACAGVPAPVPALLAVPSEPAANDPLAGVARAVGAIGHPGLAARLRRDPFVFFRYVSGPFVAATCAALGDDADRLPRVNLHGDAHLEQYAVAEDGRGLADFDAATSGPFAVDLIRFATSLRLAARARRQDAAAADRAIDALLAGYRAALRDPAAKGPEPRVVARIRQRFETSPARWLDRVESLMTPPDDATRAKIVTANEAFVGAMLQQNPDLLPAFFELRSVGVLRMGVGSTHEKKFLARVAGPSDATDDDVIFEVKEVARIEPGTCVDGDPQRDPGRVIRGQARLSGLNQRFLGFVEMDGRKFYVHTWRVNYTELGLADLETPQDLAELAFDVGLQLGRGHPNELISPAGTSLRGDILNALDRIEPRIHALAQLLEERTIASWQILLDPGPRSAVVW